MAIDLLSKQERRVAKRIARGLSEKEIATELFISPATVHNHSYNIRKKWRARSAVDVARKYILSLDNPKHFMMLVGFIAIQGHVIINCETMDLRRPTRTTVRAVRTSRKQ